MFKSSMLSVLTAAALLFISTVPVHAATFNFSGTLAFIDIDTGTSIYAGSLVGDTFSGSITYGDSAGDATAIGTNPTGTDYEFAGAPYGSTLTNGTTSISGSITEVAIDNNTPLGDDADLINRFLGTTYASTDLIDGWGAFGGTDSAYYDIDDNLFNGLEFGSFMLSLDTTLYANTNFRAIPPGLDTVDIAIFYVWEADAAGNTTFFGMGTLNSATVVPIPAAVWLLGSGLIGLVGVARPRKS